MRTVLPIAVAASFIAVPLFGFSWQTDGTPAVQDSGILEAAKDFAATSDDGKTLTLANLTESGKTLVLYFVKRDCGSNSFAVPLFTAVASPYLKSSKVSFVTVMNADKEGYEGWKKEFGAPFRGLLDPDYKVIKSYAVRSSQASMVIKDGKIVTFWRGFSKSNLAELGGMLAEASGIKFDADLSGAPARESYG
jgi:peroxiredoxin